MTIPKQKTFDNKLIEPQDPEPKKVQCQYCRKKFKVITKKHLDVCKPYQEHLEKAKKDQKLIFDFCEKIERKSYPIDLIIPNLWNVNSMSTEDFEGLKESIRKTKGEYLKKNPIQIRALESDKYEIIDGEHRWKACKELGFAKIPAILENDVNIEEAKVMNVLYSKDRGKIDYFKLSKLLNEEYYDENGKKRYTQQELADRFGFVSKSAISEILKVFPNLKNQKFARANFDNSQLIRLSRCKNDLLREKLIEYSIKVNLPTNGIGKQATKLNKISNFLNREFLQKTRNCILTIFTGDFLFNHNYNEFIDKVFHLIVDNNHKDIIIKYTRDFALHSNIAREFKEKYIKENMTYTNWYNTYRKSSESRIASKMTWDFFNEYYNGKVPCWKCGEIIKNFNEYSDHHEEYEFKDDMLWFVFPDGDQKIFPICPNSKCHKKGTSKNWNKDLGE